MNYEIIGKGGSGTIIYPALFENNNKYAKNYVSKISEDALLKHEKYIYDNLPDEFNNKIYNKTCYYTILNKTKLNNKIKSRINENHNSQIIIKLAAGQTIETILNNNKIKKKQIYKLLKNLKYLYYSMLKLNNFYNIYHRDISIYNIIYNLNDSKIWLIDYGLAQKCKPNIKPPHDPKSDLNNTIKIINLVIEYAKKQFIINLLPINHINELTNQELHLRKELGTI